MVKKRANNHNNHNNNDNNHHIHKHKHHPVFREPLTLGQRAADHLTKFGGSWTFLIIFGVFLIIWIGINSWVLLKRPYDPYPFILLNLLLSCLAAIQAPIILMSQNRQMERDRIDAKYDYQVNRKAERGIQQLQKELVKVKDHLKEIKKKK